MERDKRRDFILISLFLLTAVYVMTPRARSTVVSEEIPQIRRPRTLVSIDTYVLNSIRHIDILEKKGIKGKELREFLIKWAGSEEDAIKMMGGDPETISRIIEERGYAYGTCHSITKYWCYLVEKEGIGWAYYAVEDLGKISHAFGAVGIREGKYIVIHTFYVIPGGKVIKMSRPFEICEEGIDIREMLLGEKVSRGSIIVRG